MKTHRSRFSKSKTKTRKIKQTYINKKNLKKQYLQLKTSTGHVFPVLIDKEFQEGMTSVKFYYGKFIPCVEIHIYDDNTTANLQTVTYNQRCSIKGLERKTGTKEMVQTSIKFVMNTFPHVQEIEISDYSSLPIDGKRSVVITAKYLLQGRPGLYQDYLSAIPTNKTKIAIDMIKNRRDAIDNTISKKINNLWTPTKIKDIAERHNINKEALLFSTWVIKREVVNTYNIQYTVHQGHIGGGPTIDFDKMEIDYNPYFRMYHDNVV